MFADFFPGILQVDEIARKPHSIVISCEMDLNLDFLLEKVRHCSVHTSLELRRSIM